ncbi:uracil-DNA glycosylase [Kineococcus gynurae]|uniref:Uracil-DNA glycosylase n=1 Tax=Kineococcus gynurae TaxID=452979 RepID=A0ABV5LW30_9ACTN
MFLDAPRQLVGDRLDERRQLLETREEVQPLREWHARWVGEGMPEFDPAEAGVGAQVLFVMDRPQGAAKPDGSGFVSVDNDDDAAELTWSFRHEAGLDETRVLMWNAYPWWSDKAPDAAGRIRGLKAFKDLLPLLPRLCVVAFCGTEAQKLRKNPTLHLGHTVGVDLPQFAARALRQAGREDQMRQGLTRIRNLVA